MKILVERGTFTPISTTGTVYLDGHQFCWSLEPPVKDGRPGSCILPGTYNVVAFMSRKFGRSMPLLENVPLRDPDARIEIHWGNTVDDTLGCVLLGGTRHKDSIGQSRQIFDDFWVLFMRALSGGEVSLTVTGGAPQQAVNLDAGDL